MKITVKELIEQLKVEDQDLEVSFGGLDFYRLKDRGGVLQVEFSQTVYLDDEGFVVVENHLKSKEFKSK
ncbi:hypothetical protein CLU83_4082 [Flavobacterium sp. 1]|uniref:hypothetical protein n=1 Tax=Flavobacterium sp. 1 TaxID=2035200 RepID=UPI000C23661A|nr:hypothetical protein [Flavobacterium sp. 1]PJJ10631.1 hypothetical protein CLU83_4082 [Flavobacterium sp. 1]